MEKNDANKGRVRVNLCALNLIARQQKLHICLKKRINLRRQRIHLNDTKYAHSLFT